MEQLLWLYFIKDPYHNRLTNYFMADGGASAGKKFPDDFPYAGAWYAFDSCRMKLTKMEITEYDDDGTPIYEMTYEHPSCLALCKAMEAYLCPSSNHPMYATDTFLIQHYANMLSYYPERIGNLAFFDFRESLKIKFTPNEYVTF